MTGADDGRERQVDRVVAASDLDSSNGDSTVAGVVLAAGLSSRYGDDNKLLQRVDGDPLVRRAARTLVAADLSRVVVVVGYEADRVRDCLADLPVTTVDNPEYETGMASSVRRGVAAVSDADAAVFALGDMPWVAPATVDALVAAFRAGVGDPLAASYRGERGNPVLFGHRYFAELSTLEGDRGARRLILEAPEAALVETDDPGVRRDVDSPADLRGHSDE